MYLPRISRATLAIIVCAGQSAFGQSQPTTGRFAPRSAAAPQAGSAEAAASATTDSGEVASPAGITITGEAVTPAATAVIRYTEVAERARAMPATSAPTPRVRPRRTIPEPVAATTSRPTVQPLVADALSNLTPSPAPTTSFQTVADNNTYIPPDTMGAVGPAHVMTTLNTQTRIQSRSGAVISTVLTNAFWASVLPSGSTGTFDPRLLYDPYASRWIYAIACDGDNGNASVCIGVSQTSDPTGTWYLFRVDTDSSNTLLADYPMLGFNKDWIVVSVNMYSLSTGSFRHGQIYAFNKANLYANSNAGMVVYASTSVPSGMHPATTYDNTTSMLFFVRNYSSAGGTIRKSALIGSPPAAPTLSIDTAVATSTLGGWTIPGDNFLPQLGTSVRVDAGGDARMQSVFARTVGGVTSIWCAQNIALPAGGVANRAAVQWWQLDGNSAISTIVRQQGRVEDPTATQFNGGKHFAYPSLAVNQYGDLLIGYSRFQLTAYPAAAYSLRLVADAAGTMRDDATLKLGEGPYDRSYSDGYNRWGDYSHTVVDPVNDRDFWTVQEYAAPAVGVASLSGRWATWWGNLAVRTPPTIVTQPASQTIVVGANAGFNVVATATPAATLQWQRQPAGTTGFTDLTNGSTYSGVTGESLTVNSATTAMSGDQFRCVASNGILPNAVSNAATLTVNPPLTTIMPTTRTAVADGESYSITVASNTSWTASSNQTWATVSPASGNGNGSVMITVAPVTSASSRTATITIGGQSHALTQNGATTIVITTQPVNQFAVPGSTVGFVIRTTGTRPLAYQWYWTPSGSSIPQALNDITGKLFGTHAATLYVDNVQAADAGDYVCIVTNAAGTVTSMAASLLIFDRYVQIGNSIVAPNTTFVVRVTLFAHGDENALGFSMSFDPTKLGFVSAAVSPAPDDVTMNIDSSQAGAGKIGLAFAKPAGAVWSAGWPLLVRITFSVGNPVGEPAVLPVTFDDVPVARGISSVAAMPLPAGYRAGSVLVTRGYEADMNGNGMVTITDWVKVGRLVAGLEEAATELDYMKADCAPRWDRGNGMLSITDWVQAGRYAAGLDPLTPVVGPLPP